MLQIGTCNVSIWHVFNFKLMPSIDCQALVRQYNLDSISIVDWSKLMVSIVQINNMKPHCRHEACMTHTKYRYQPTGIFLDKYYRLQLLLFCNLHIILFQLLDLESNETLIKMYSVLLLLLLSSLTVVDIEAKLKKNYPPHCTHVTKGKLIVFIILILLSRP